MFKEKAALKYSVLLVQTSGYGEVASSVYGGLFSRVCLWGWVLDRDYV